jgi:hypothetical protein
VKNAVIALVAGAHFSGVRIFNPATVSHARSFSEVSGGRQKAGGEGTGGAVRDWGLMT